MNKIQKQIQKEKQRLSILKECSLTIEKGDMVAITGQSGIGKSTLLNIIGCLDEPSSGSYYLDNLNITSLSPEQKSEIRKKTFGYVFQQYWLIRHLSILENIELAMYYRAMNNQREIAMATLKKLDLLDQKDKLPGQLSGGQQQKASIARAIATKPKIIIADEPTGALDNSNSNQVMGLLKKINDSFNTTIIMVTHDKNMAKQCKQEISMESLFHNKENEYATN